MQYEFRGKTLEEAVRKAVAQPLFHKTNDEKRFVCLNLKTEIDRASRQVENAERDVRNAKRDLDNLRDSRDENINDAALAAVITASGVLASVLRPANILKRLLSGKNPSLEDALTVVPYLGGGIATVRSSLAAYRNVREIENVLSTLENVRSNTDSFRRDLLRLKGKWEGNECGSFIY